MQDKVALVLAVERLRPDHFRAASHRGIFEALSYLSSKGGDFGPASVIDYLERQPELSMINSMDVYKLEHAEGYVQIGEHELNIDLLVLRYQQEQLTAGAKKLFTGLEALRAESLDELDMHLAALESGYRSGQPIGRADLIEYTECLEQVEEHQERGLLTGYAELDRHIDLREGQILTIYGDTGSKKTTLCMNFVARWAIDKQIAVYNYEQKPIEIARMVADCDRGQIPKGNLWISPNPPPIESLPSQIKAIKLKRGLDGIVLDYIQTVPAVTRDLAENENNLVRYVMRAMRDIAQQESIWVVIVAQMRKAHNDTGGDALNPSLDKMRGSGEIKMASSIILSVVLPWKCDMQTIDERTTEHLMSVRIKKNRDCLTGNPGEEREVKLVHQPDNRRITPFNEMEHFMPPGGTG